MAHSFLATQEVIIGSSDLERRAQVFGLMGLDLVNHGKVVNGRWASETVTLFTMIQ